MLLHIFRNFGEYLNPSAGNRERGREATSNPFFILFTSHPSVCCGILFTKGGRSMRETIYDRDAAVAYARRWALERNPDYYDFENVGGDCTNFASQCIYAGARIMNFTRDTGWYYRSSHDRAAAWTGVEYLYQFLVNNKSVGPFGHLVSQREAEPGDIVQLGTFGGKFYHSPVITSVSRGITVAAHTYDALDRPLRYYDYDVVRFIHIDGVRVW